MFRVDEWWDGEGTYHPGPPSESQMLDEAVQMTVHVWDDEGNKFWFTTFSDDGWEPEELEADVEDAESHYVQGEQ